MQRHQRKRFPFSMSAVLLLVLATGCARQSQNTYNYDEVGKSAAVSFGTIISTRMVDITGKNTGLGALGGAAGGAAVGSQIGSGAGNAGAIAGGLVVGAIAAGLAEQALSDRRGVEYAVTLESGVTLTIVQETPTGERIMAPGERVMIQNSGGYQRVLSAVQLPTQIKRPEGVKLVN